MRQVAIVLLTFAIASETSWAQTDATKMSIDSLRRNFVVPEAPAMTLLDVDSSKILRPSTARELGVELANSAGGTIGIPSALAVEFSPALLIGGRKATIADYQQLAALYRLRLSLATKRDSGSKGLTQLAVGLRTSLYDDGDPRTNRSILDTLQTLLRGLARIHNSRDSALHDVCIIGATNTDSAHKSIDDALATRGVRGLAPCLAAHPSMLAQVTADLAHAAAPIDTVATVRASLYRRSDSLLATFKSRTDAARQHYDSTYRAWTNPDSLWNRASVDVAIAMRGSAADSLGRGLVADDYSAWLTGASGISQSWQWLIGVQIATDRDTAAAKHRFRGSGHLAGRLYFGSNNYRAYGEIQGGAAVGNRASWTFSGGGELSLGAGFWATAGAGWAESGPKTGRVISRLGIKAGVPGGK